MNGPHTVHVQCSLPVTNTLTSRPLIGLQSRAKPPPPYGASVMERSDCQWKQTFRVMTLRFLNSEFKPKLSLYGCCRRCAVTLQWQMCSDSAVLTLVGSSIHHCGSRIEKSLTDMKVGAQWLGCGAGRIKSMFIIQGHSQVSRFLVVMVLSLCWDHFPWKNTSLLVQVELQVVPWHPLWDVSQVSSDASTWVSDGVMTWIAGCHQHSCGGRSHVCITAPN